MPRQVSDSVNDQGISAAQAATTRHILDLLFRYRRAQSAADPCVANPCAECYGAHEKKARAFVAAGRPIQFVLLAFPAKSPNPAKTLGRLPDLAERLALNFLQVVCDQIRHYHAPGAQVIICSDGHVFSDLVSVSDPDVTAYRDELLRVFDAWELGSLAHYSLADAYGTIPFPDAREALLRDWATPLPVIRERVMADADARALFNGIHRFMFEDRIVARPRESRSKARGFAKDAAYRVTQRSNAWSDLVADAFPGMLRLSIHPQPCHSPKLGIHLIPTRDAWLTPWHGVALDDGEQFTLVKRAAAERTGASLVTRNGRPSHYVAPHVMLAKETPCRTLFAP